MAEVAEDLDDVFASDDDDDEEEEPTVKEHSANEAEPVRKESTSSIPAKETKSEPQTSSPLLKEAPRELQKPAPSKPCPERSPEVSRKSAGEEDSRIRGQNLAESTPSTTTAQPELRQKPVQHNWAESTPSTTTSQPDSYQMKYSQQIRTQSTSRTAAAQLEHQQKPAQSTSTSAAPPAELAVQSKPVVTQPDTVSETSSRGSASSSPALRSPREPIGRPEDGKAAQVSASTNGNDLLLPVLTWAGIRLKPVTSPPVTSYSRMNLEMGEGVQV